jgi:hypothetical protein
MCEGEAGVRSIRKPAERRILYILQKKRKLPNFWSTPKNVSVGAILRRLQYSPTK